jgi:ribonuclease P/MRP protein subunit POP5
MAFELETEGINPVHPKDLMEEILAAQFSLFGELGAASNRLKLIAFNGRRGLLRCHHQHLSQTRAVLASICSVRGMRIALHSKGVSGTIKTATEKYLPPLGKTGGESDGRRIELEEISGCIISTRGLEVDLCPDDRSKTKGSDTLYLGLTSFDLSGGHEHADGTADGL